MTPVDKPLTTVFAISAGRAAISTGGKAMKEREIATAERYGILQRIKSIEADLLQIKFAVGVEFDLDGFYDDLDTVIILVKYDIPIASDTYFEDRKTLLISVIEKVKEHGLKRTTDRIEDYGAHFYFVFSIADKEKFYGK